MELTSSYLYLAMAAYFDRDEVALPGFSRFFLTKSTDEREHGILCINYMNKRGGRVRLDNIEAPQKLTWKGGLEAMEEALEWEKKINAIIVDMHQTASRNNDPQFTAFVEKQFFDEQTEEIKQLANYVGILRKIGQGLGEFEFDFEILQKNGRLTKFGTASPISPEPGNTTA